MDEKTKAIIRMHHMHICAAAQVVCIVASWWVKRRLRNKIETEDEDEDESETEDCGSLIRSKKRGNSEVVTSSRRAKKTKTSDTDEEVIILANAINSVADAIRESTRILVDAITPKDPTKICDVWKFVEDIGIDSDNHVDAYVYLFEKPNLLEALNRSPMNHRKGLLLECMTRDNAFKRD